MLLSRALSLLHNNYKGKKKIKKHKKSLEKKISFLPITEKQKRTWK